MKKNVRRRFKKKSSTILLYNSAAYTGKRRKWCVEQQFPLCYFTSVTCLIIISIWAHKKANLYGRIFDDIVGTKKKM